MDTKLVCKKMNCIETGVDKWSNPETIFLGFFAASEELVWTQTSKWIRRWAWHDLNIQVLLETCVLFQALLPAWNKEGIRRWYFICLWFSVKSKEWYQLPWKCVEISWWKVI